MASTHYWDVTSCRWRPCHDEAAGAPSPMSLETDRAALAGATTAATPTSAVPDAATVATEPMAPAAGTGADIPQA